MEKMNNSIKIKRDFNKESVEIHRKLKGKLEITSKMEINDKNDLSLAYTPGVGQVSKEIAKDKNRAYDLTMKNNTIAIVSDGSAVLGLGNIGPEAALPVMEGKSILFKKLGNINAIPLCINTQNTEEIISFVKNIAPTFAGINLEDISAPRCFEIEERLQDIGIPVFHDDQHGTAIVILAALTNALKLAEKNITDIKVVINGAGAAGTAITKLLKCIDCESDMCKVVKEIIVCDSKGIISKNRKDIEKNNAKLEILSITNNANLDGILSDAIRGADVFIGVSTGNVLSKDMIKSMNPKPIIFAMANPIPEIMPEDAYAAGAFIVGTGRSDYPNQINNVLAFPGVFKGTIESRAKRITNYMKLSAAFALANSIKNLNKNNILPDALSEDVPINIAKAVKKAAQHPIENNEK